MSEWLCEIILIGEWVGALLLPVRAAMKGEIKGVRWRDGQEWMMGPSSSSPPSSISACCCCFGSTSAGGSSQGEVIWARRPAASDLSSKFDPLRGLHNTWEMTESPPSCSKSWMMSAEEQRAERARRRSAWTGRNRGCRKALMRGPSAGRAASAPRDMSELAAKRAAETQFPFCNAAVKTWMTPWKLYRLNYYYYYGTIHACFLNKFIFTNLNFSSNESVDDGDENLTKSSCDLPGKTPVDRDGRNGLSTVNLAEHRKDARVMMLLRAECDQLDKLGASLPQRINEIFAVWRICL